MKRVSALTKAKIGCWVLFGSALIAAALLDSQQARIGACLIAGGCAAWLVTVPLQRSTAEVARYREYVSRVSLHMATLAATANNERAQHSATLGMVVAQRDALAGQVRQAQLPETRRVAAQAWIRTARDLSGLDLAEMAIGVDQLSGMRVDFPEVADLRHQNFIERLTRMHAQGVAQLFVRLTTSMSEIRTSGVNAARLEQLSAILERLVQLEAIKTPAQHTLLSEARSLERACTQALARVPVRIPVPVAVPMRA